MSDILSHLGKVKVKVLYLITYKYTERGQHCKKTEEEKTTNINK